MSASILAALGDAIEIDSWDHSVHQIKTIVRNALRATDSSVSVEDTHYFNHSFVPDLKLSWKDAPHLGERPVFLRMGSELADFEEDLQHVVSSRPMFLGLQALSPEVHEIIPAARQQHSLVTDATAVEDLGGPTESAHAAVLPTMVLRGGEGVLDEQATQTFVQAGDSAFRGAEDRDPQGVTSGVEALREVLGRNSLDQVTTFLRVIWGTSGQTESTFPLASDLTSVSDDVLRFLISHDSKLEVQMLRELGNDVTINRLLRLGLGSDAPHLAEFIEANADRLEGKSMVVHDSQDTLAPRGRWEILPKYLEFAGSDFVAFIAPSRGDAPDGIESRPLTVDHFKSRVTGRRLQSISLMNEGELVTIESDRDEPIVESSALEALSPLGASVHKAVVAVNGKQLICDFRKVTATGHTSAQFSLIEFLGAGLPVLRDLEDSDRQYIRDAAETIANATVRQLDMFE
jgi:hypothetical protein